MSTYKVPSCVPLQEVNSVRVTPLWRSAYLRGALVILDWRLSSARLAFRSAPSNLISLRRCSLGIGTNEGLVSVLLILLAEECEFLAPTRPAVERKLKVPCKQGVTQVCMQTRHCCVRSSSCGSRSLACKRHGPPQNVFGARSRKYYLPRT